MNECKHEKTNKVGTRAYITGLYVMRRCVKCGHHFKAEKIEERK